MSGAARNQARNVELAKIHIGKAQLGLDDVVAAGNCTCGRARTAYHEMLWTIARVHSAKDLDQAGRRRVLDHLRSRGFRDTSRGRPHNAARSPQIRKIEALLADAARPWAYADGMAKRMFHVDRVAFCRPDQLHRLIAALAIDAKRRAQRTSELKSCPVPDRKAQRLVAGCGSVVSAAPSRKTATAGGEDSPPGCTSELARPAPSSLPETLTDE